MAITIYLSLFFLALYAVAWIIHRLLFLRARRQMEEESRDGARVIAKVDELKPGTVRKFWLICQRYRVDGFLVNDGGKFHAYVNRCRHMPTPLDFVRDQFISEDGRFLRCYTHGALYEFSTGLCVDGPCKGESLFRLPVRVDGVEIRVACPEGDLKQIAD